MDMRQPSLERNIRILHWLSVDALLFAGAVIIAYEMHEIGLSLTQILMGEAVFALTILLFEIPTGMFSDLVSRKQTLFLAQIFFFSGVIVFALATEFWHVIVSQILTGIAVATVSGTDSAMLYDTLKALGREHEHKKIWGSIKSFQLIVIAVGQATGGFVATMGLRIPILLCIPISLFTLVMVLQLVEPPRQKNDRSQLISHMKSALRFVLFHRVMFFLIFAAVFVTLSRKITLQTLNPYWEMIQTPIIYWGLLMAAFNIIAAVVAKKAHLIQEKLGSLHSFFLMYTFWIVGFLMLAFVHVGLAFLWPMLHWMLRPFGDIFFADEINKRTASSHRATVLSLSNLAAQSMQVMALPILGYVADVWSLEVMYVLMAFVLAIAAVVAGFGIYGADPLQEEGRF